MKSVNGELVELTEAEIFQREIDHVRWSEAKAAREKQSAIVKLEAEITPRRIREAILGDNGWLAAKEAEIAELRNA